MLHIELDIQLEIKIGFAKKNHWSILQVYETNFSFLNYTKIQRIYIHFWRILNITLLKSQYIEMLNIQSGQIPQLPCNVESVRI
jgi:hypothetical protein